MFWVISTLTDAFRVNQTECIDYDLSLDRLNRVDDNSNASRVQLLKRL